MLTVDFINVGYGDAILIRHQEHGGNMTTVLIDGGDADQGHFRESANRIECIDFLRWQKINAIDLLVMTHLHKDHVGGLEPVVSGFPVKEAWINVNLPENRFGESLPETAYVTEAASDVHEGINSFSRILHALHAKGTAIRRMTQDRGSITLAPGLVFTHLFGHAGLYDRQDEIVSSLLAGDKDREPLLLELHGFINNTSTVLKAEYRQVMLLFGADVYATFWQDRIPPSCHVLKLPHHGHKDSMTSEIAQSLKPEHVVISVSDNRTDDCPSMKAVEAFLSFSRMPQVCCTDATGIEAYCQAHAHQAVRFQIDEQGTLTRAFVRRDGQDA